MGDFEDMNATPLGKLPMPAVQSKNDGPRVDMSSSYSDILKEITAPAQQQQHMQQHMQMQQQHMQQPQPQAQMQAMPSQFSQAQFQGNDDMAYQQQAPMYQPPPHARRHHRQQPEPKQARRGGGGGGGGGVGGVWAKIKEYKSSVLVTLIVFLILSYVTPKLASTVPQLLNQTGKFNALGLFVIAGTCGGIHRVMDHYVK